MSAKKVNFINSVETDDNYDGKEDELKGCLRREVLKMVVLKLPLKKLWGQMKKQTGNDCKKLWNEIQESIVKKVIRLLEANDFLEEVPSAMLVTASDWHLFDMVLVHQNLNIINFERLQPCLNELFNLIQEHKVETLYGDELAVAWIRITLQYNKGGRKCSPMLLQLRWYQLKQMSRQQVYYPVADQDKEKIKMLHTIAIKNQKIITQPFPKWDLLVEQKRVILPDQFLKILKGNKKWKEIKNLEEWYFQINQDILKSDIEVKSEIIDVSEDYSIFDPKKNPKNIGVVKAHPKFGLEIKKILKNEQKITGKINNGVTGLNEILEEKAKLMSTELQKNRASSNNVGVNRNEILWSESKEVITKDKIIKRKNDRIFSNLEILEDGIKIDKSDITKNKKQKIESHLVSSSYENDGHIKGNEDTIDPKLVMKAIVYTKKLEYMKVFQHIDYSIVRSNKVIEIATMESKPIFRHTSSKYMSQASAFKSQKE